MSFKKRFEQQVNASLNQYNNEDFLNELKEKQKQNTTETRRIKPRNLIISISSGLLAVVAIVLTCVFAIPKTNGGSDRNKPDESVGYMQQYDTLETSSLSAANAAMTGLQLNDVQDISVSRAYDLPSGDTLRYSAACDLNEGFDSLHVDIVVNENYSFYFPYTLDKATTAFGYDMQYKEDISLDEDMGIYICSVKAILTTDNEKIYIDYSGYSISEEFNFESSLAQLFSKTA